MLYQNIAAFKEFYYQNKLTLDRMLILIQDDFERKKIIAMILGHPDLKKFAVKKINEENFAKVKEEFFSFSLFNEEPLFVVQNFSEDLGKNLKEFVALSQEQAALHAIIGAKNKTEVKELYDIFNKTGCVLDLSHEKIWDREKRLKDYLLTKITHAKKNITKETLDAFLNLVGPDPSLADQEMEKLITYAYEKTEIAQDDIKAVCIRSQMATVWQTAEDLIWQQKDTMPLHVDSTFFHAFIAALRFNLTFGLKIISLVETNAPVEKIQESFPKVFPKVLERRKEMSIRLKKSFFQKALAILFRIEVLSKSSLDNYELLLDLFKFRVFDHDNLSLA